MQNNSQYRWAALAAACCFFAGLSLFAADPDQILRDRQLVRVGTYVVAAEETDVLAGTHTLHISSARQASDERTRRELKIAIEKAIVTLDNLGEKLTDAENVKKKADDRSRAAAIVRYNAALADFTRQNNLVEDQIRHHKALQDSRASYIDLDLEMMDKAAVATAHYEAVTQDPAVQTAIAALNQSAKHPFKLGPSPAFTQAVEFMLTCRDGLVSDTVPIVMEGPVPEVQVVINGAPPITMIWDSGAAYVSLSAPTAATLGLHPTAQDETETMVTADGTKVNCKRMKLQSVRVGNVTVENVACIIGPPGKNSPSLLGGAFQGRCVCRLDVPGKKVLLTRLDPPEPGYKAATHAVLPVVSRRLAVAPVRSTGPHITVLKRSPDEVFKEKQLIRQGLLVISSDEAEVRTMVNAVREARKKADSEAVLRRDCERDYRWTLTNIRDLEAKTRRLNLQVGKATSDQERRDASNAHNAALNQWRQVEAKQKELLKKLVAMPDTRLTFLGYALEAQERIVQASARYAALAADDEVNLAIAKLNTETPGTRLGPSGAFLADGQFIADCNVDPNSGMVPILVEGSTASVDVMLNEKAKVRMTWDSGASSVMLSAAMAAQAGLYPTDRDPSVPSHLADGRVVPMKVMMLASVRVGCLMVRNVRCTILPPEVQVDEGLLGIAFQRHFNCRLDLQAGQLQLTRIDVPETSPENAIPPTPAVAVTPTPTPTPTPTAPLPAPQPASARIPARNGAGNVLLFVGNPKEQGIFADVGGKVKIVNAGDTARALADPQTYSGSNVIVFGRNTLVNVPEETFTDAICQNIRQFMQKGGDMVVFEQTAGNPELERRLIANFQFFEVSFRVLIHRQGRDKAAPEPALAAGAQAAGLADDVLTKVRFYNWYTVPTEATVLVRAGVKRDAVAAMVPVENGRLIFVGTNLDPADEPLDRVIFRAVYSGK